jgi:hypothetical protein
MAAQSAFQPDIDVLVLVGRDPGLALDEILAAERPRLHRGVDLVASPVEEAGVDEGHPVLRRADAFLEVDRGAPLLVHDAELHGVALQPQHLLDQRERLVGEGHFLGPVHLRLHDIDRPRDGVPRAGLFAQVVLGDERGDHRVHQPLVGLRPVLQQDRRVGHQVADVPHQHQRAALDGEVEPSGAV